MDSSPALVLPAVRGHRSVAVRLTWTPAAVLALCAGVLGLFGAVYANWGMLLGDRLPSIQGVDDTGYYLWLRSLVIDGDCDFSNDIAEAPTMDEGSRAQWLATERTPVGRVPNKFPIGWAIASSPAFLVGHGVALLSGMPADGWTPPYFVAIWLWHLGLAVLGLWWAWKIASRFAPRPMAACAVLCAWVASPMVFYHSARIGMAHGLLFTLMAGAYWFSFVIHDRRDRWWHWAALGLLSILAMLTRGSAVVFLLFPALVAVEGLAARSNAERIRLVTAWCLPCATGVIVAAWAAWTVHGSFLVQPYPGESFHFTRPRLFEVLFSSRHGLFYWHPFLLLGIAGLAWGIRRRVLPLSWGISALGIYYVNASWHCWWFGSSFGNRAFDGVVLLSMIGLAWLLGRVPQTRAWRLAGAVLAAVAVVSGSLLFLQYITGAISREGAVSHAEMLEAALAMALR